MRRKFYTILRDREKSVSIVPPNTAVVPLQAKGVPPVFFMVDSYPYFIDVVQLMTADRPVLSLVSQEDTQASLAEYSIHDEAAAHVQSILERQPTGPYFLGGCSASGIVAYEIAAQLRTLGHKVRLLVLFDTPNPCFMGEYSAWRRSLAANRSQLRQLRWREIPNWMRGKSLDWARRSTRWMLRGLTLQDKAMSDEMIGPLESRISAAQHYRPQPFAGTLLIVKRRRDFLHGRYRDEYYGWREMVVGELAVCEVSAGDHLDIFKNEVDRTRVAELLSSYMSESAPLSVFPEFSAAGFAGSNG